jgi:hypothetical protein
MSVAPTDESTRTGLALSMQPLDTVGCVMVTVDATILTRLRHQVVVLAKRYASDVSDLQGRMDSVKEEADRRMALVIAYRERAKVYAELNRLRWWSRRRRRELLSLLQLDSL